jgi:hypothetical protein
VAAPTYIQDAESSWANTSTQTKVTASFNANSGDVLVACCMAMRSDNPLFPATISDNSGLGLTWTKRKEIQVDVATHYIAIWTTTLPSAVSGMTVTFTKGNNTTATIWGGVVQTWRGATAGAFGTGSVIQAFGATTFALTTQGANSAIIFYEIDSSAQDGSSATYSTATAGAFTETTNDFGSFDHGIWGGYHADAGAAGAKTVGQTVSSNQIASAAGVEIQGGGGAAPGQRWGRVAI